MAARDEFEGLAPEEAVEFRADRLKERVYVTFTALAVVLALRTHPEDGHPFRTLLITVVGTALATFVADVVSHVAVHAVLPDRREVRLMARISSGAVGAVMVPALLVGLGAAGVFHIERALNAAMVTLIAALAAIGWLAVRRVRLPRWQKAIALLAELVIGSLVIAVELLAHG